MHPAEALDPSPTAGSALRADLPKAARVYATLREAIIAMQLKPGTRLVEKDLCDELGVSRTPLRDAILRLAQQRLVTVVPSDATFVNKIILDEVIEGQLVRESLELRMVALAAERFEPARQSAFELVLFREADAARRGDNAESFALDNDFHRLLCACAGFPRVWDTIHLATGQLDRVRRNAFPLQNYHVEVLDEHRAIFEALCRRDAEHAVSLLRTHLGGTLNSLRILLAREPDFVAFDPASPAFALLRRSEQAGDAAPPGGAEGSPRRRARRSVADRRTAPGAV
ncbi:DNA-binding GntR family transcriptional regulator [Methylobacterium sp. PvP062]|jgi:DNA-binding GntR family transcriptional regulator|uniref:DNA-binding GntR family transcriptional regulator n=1 Tax=Methylobacterium radiotolerans TaxID=31998 RepID=A0ABV2NKW6_9HYPH|nr:MULTISPECIES: GntR family transcriptional regulator [unclassified Methylobacterium]KZC00472.1 HTH-type transcriptional repressor RspR [Methylobacterium radiotolerans]MBE7196571.1 GntR family transcriptional regulator [Parafilimonas terrae]MCX7336026.1 GntR family transcriptional regulator [Hyphomicrobiales bacterium]MBP2496194.1 DNA-binding GntR family transcriptional regulator [Methylobacterium sp. PvP105]MBP2503934.1 DNA-binding GntR family transcriptional regulator [Methylobacterium sp. 